MTRLGRRDRKRQGSIGRVRREREQAGFTGVTCTMDREDDGIARSSRSSNARPGAAYTHAGPNTFAERSNDRSQASANRSVATLDPAERAKNRKGDTPPNEGSRPCSAGAAE